MRKIISYLRINEWLASKVTMMVGVFAYFLHLSNLSGHSVLMGTIVYFLFLSAFLAISYIANDYSDIEVDKKAGKEKVISKLKPWQIWGSFVLLFIIGNGPLIFYCSNKKYAIVLVIITYVLGLAYSTLGIRFKEKGIWGLIECSFAQRCMPLIIISAILSLDKIQILLLCGWVVISFLDGLRYIIIHQVIDMENDIKSGVVTYAIQKKRNFRGLLVGLFVIDVLGTFIIMTPILINHFVASILCWIAFGLLEFGIYKVLNVYAQKDWFCTFDSVPFEAFLNCGMPLLTGFCVVVNNRLMWVYMLIVCVIAIKPLIVKIQMASIYFRKR